jgi:hypothetical protein
MAVAIKAEVGNPRAARFEFVAQKTPYVGISDEAAAFLERFFT